LFNVENVFVKAAYDSLCQVETKEGCVSVYYIHVCEDYVKTA